MPIFHFDVRQGATLAEDKDGADFVDLTAAEEEARRSVLEIAKFRLLDADEVSVDVRNDARCLVLIVTASVAITRVVKPT